MLVSIVLSAFTFLPQSVELIRAGVMDTIELEGEKAVKFSEDVLFTIHGKELNCNLALFLHNKTLTGSGHIVFRPGPDLTITAQEFTYDARKDVVHFSSKVQVKAQKTTGYTSLIYSFKTNSIQSSTPVE